MLRVAPWKGGRFGGKCLVDRFLEILGYAYPEVRHEDGLHSVLIRKHELQLELQWFVASNEDQWLVCGMENYGWGISSATQCRCDNLFCGTGYRVVFVQGCSTLGVVEILESVGDPTFTVQT